MTPAVKETMTQTAVVSQKRLIAMFVIMCMLFAILGGRLFQLQVLDSEELVEKAESQWTRDTALTAERGTIYDCNGIVLAQSGTAYKIVIWPKSIKVGERERVATELAGLLDMDYAKVLEKVSDNTKSEIILKRQVERETVEKLEELKLGSGVGTAIDTKRYYPSGTLLSQLLGFTTVDSVGQSGLEQKYNTYLAGTDGRMVTETDARGDALAYGSQEIVDPVDGCSIKLTTDSVTQSILEKALDEALKVNNAKSAQGIVMRCTTGEIVALCSKPDYDPNSPPRSDMDLLNELSRNRIVCDAYEPGSTFKIVTLASALDSGAVTVTGTSFSCPGYHIVNGERIKCWKSGGHGTQTLTKAVQNSCNPAFMRMALAMGKETFYDYIYAFGFGSTTGSGITGESAGIVTHEKYINDNTLARIGFGQSIAVTPIQLCTAVCTAVNGGKLYQPYVVDSISAADGTVIKDNEPVLVRQVISEQTSQTVREILESVVSEGSGKNAAIPGYRVGGKTGTAQKYDSGGIAEGKLIASFIGFAPADDPEYVVLILVDEPQADVVFGSTIAAPFVRTVMEETLRHSGYLPSDEQERVAVPEVAGLTVKEARKKLEDAGLEAVCMAEDDSTVVLAQVPSLGIAAGKGSQVLLYTSYTEPEPAADDDEELVTVPGVKYMTKLEAHDALKARGLEILIDPPGQTGKAIRQNPEAGTKVAPGTRVLVEFSDTDIGN